jgi:hypothetical protein
VCGLTLLVYAALTYQFVMAEPRVRAHEVHILFYQYTHLHHQLIYHLALRAKKKQRFVNEKNTKKTGSISFYEALSY